MSANEDAKQDVAKLRPQVEQDDGELRVRIGGDGAGFPTMQMNRVSSLKVDLNGLEVTVGNSGVGGPMMQMNAVTSVNVQIEGLDMSIGDERQVNGPQE